jgi:hypothetical protein
MATEAQLLQRVYSHIGAETESGFVKPMVLAMAKLAFKDLAHLLIDSDSELAKKLVKTLSGQTWASSAFEAPSDMVFHKQKKTTRIDLAGALAHQVEDRKKLDLLSTSVNHYYALEGKTFYIRHATGVTGASTLRITYYKIPVIADIDDELMNTLVELIIRRLMPTNIDKIDRDMTGMPPAPQKK